MRCECCNRNLNDFESTAKHAKTQEYLNQCRSCLKGSGIPVYGRSDLKAEEPAPDDWFDVGIPTIVNDVSFFDED